MTAAASTAPRARSSSNGLAEAVAVLLVGVLLSAHMLGTSELAVGYLLTVVLLAVAWAVVIDPPGRVGVSVIGVLVAMLVGGLQLSSEEGTVEILLAGAVVALVAAMVLQILRRPPRAGVVASLSSTATLGMVVVGGATLITLAESERSDELASLYVAVAVATLLVGRLVDAVSVRPELRPGLGRSIVGLILGLLAGLAVGAAFAPRFEGDEAVAILVAGLVSLAAVVADLVAAHVVAFRRRPVFLAACLTAAIAMLAAAPAAEISSRLLG